MVVGDVLHDFQLAAALQVMLVAERVVPDPALDTSDGCAALNPVGVLLPHGVAGQRAGPPASAASLHKIVTHFHLERGIDPA
jgi:hypothetical protein